MRVVLALALLTALGGCDKLLSLTPVGPTPADARAIDGAPDGAPDAMPPDAPDAQTRLCAGSLYFNTCAEIVGLPSLTYGAPATIHTDTDCTTTQPQTGGPAVCVIIASQILVSANVRVVGSRPLALVALESLQITSTGTIDASSDSSMAGAGANVSTCGSQGGKAQGASDSYSGGGAGGSFGGLGGNGGAGPATTDIALAGGAISATVVRGGCRGGAGGPNNMGAFAFGGPSGGAVYLVARQDLIIDGRVLANGVGGNGGPGNNLAASAAGGGGGGSGGLIALDAMNVQLGGNCLLQASGGGGGGGSTNLSGFPGGTPNPATFNSAALGGSDGAGSSNGAGGSGSLAADGGGGFRPTAAGQGGAGGGGGGAGHIRVFPASTVLNGNHVPMPTS